MTARKIYKRRSTSEVSYCLKFTIFEFNAIILLIGFLIILAGVWACYEKGTLNNLGRTTIALDPAFTLICIGTITFLIGITGCIGALREITCLLSIHVILLTLILISELAIGLSGFIYKDWIKNKLKSSRILEGFIIHYRDDPDQQNLIDWIQEDWLQCCGITGPDDWDLNNYFNCSSSIVGSNEACGVPFSCCKHKADEIIKNVQCGINVRSGINKDISKIINEIGCLQAFNEWIESNLLTIVWFCIVMLFIQILSICFVQNLRADIYAQKAKLY